jgi:hypothetical protein
MIGCGSVMIIMIFNGWNFEPSIGYKTYAPITITAVKVDINVDISDSIVNSICSGLDESTLRFELNGTVINNALLTIGRIYQLVGGENILKELHISYVPLASQLIPGTNTVKVDIDDMVDNHMNQVIKTFNRPF